MPNGHIVKIRQRSLFPGESVGDTSIKSSSCHKTGYKSSHVSSFAPRAYCENSPEVCPFIDKISVKKSKKLADASFLLFFLLRFIRK